MDQVLMQLIAMGVLLVGSALAFWAALLAYKAA
jgi:hypothetical protein